MTETRVIQIFKDNNCLSVHEDTLFHLMNLIRGNFKELIEDIHDMMIHRGGLTITVEDTRFAVKTIWGVKTSRNVEELGLSQLRIESNREKLQRLLGIKVQIKKRKREYMVSTHTSWEWDKEIKDSIDEMMSSYVIEENQQDVENVLIETFQSIVSRYVSGVCKFQCIGMELMPIDLLRYMKKTMFHKTQTWKNVTNRIKFGI